MRHRSFYLFITAFVLLAALICTLSDKRVEAVQSGYTTPLIPSEWQEVMADEMNSTVPKVFLSGKQIMEVDSAKPYITNEMEVMIPLNMLKSGLNASITVDSQGILKIYRGNHKIDINLTNDQVTIDGETGVIAGAALKINSNYYVVASVLSKGLHLDYSWDRGTSKVSLDLPQGEENPLPSKFSYTEVERMPQVYNQGNFGTCWAFASLTALETYLLPSENMSFSREHMVLNNGFNIDMFSGGDYHVALAYLLAWQGPVLAENDSYGDQVTDSSLLPVKHVQSVVLSSKKDIDAIKQAVFTTGGVEATLYLAMADSFRPDLYHTYYNSKTMSYCYQGENDVNHDVTIVGWDDGYSKWNFVNGEEIAGDGAFLCMNSWGSDFGNRGTFWVSYYDDKIASNYMYFTQVEQTNNYAYNYQTDLCGATASIGYGSSTAYFANVYQSHTRERLSAVGFYTMGKNTTYEVYAVNHYEDSTSLQEKVKVGEGSLPEEGFFTVNVDEIELEEGENFALIVKIQTPESTYPVAVERRTDEFSNVIIEDGVGFISSDGINFSSTETEQDCNICLKAYTKLR